MKLNKQLPDSYMNQILNKLKELVQKVESCFQSGSYVNLTKLIVQV